MKYIVTIKNYGSITKGKPYIVEARCNGKLVNEKRECFRTLKKARRHVEQFFKGIDIEEDIRDEKDQSDYEAAMQWYESLN